MGRVIFAIDPGPIESGWCLLNGTDILCGKSRNEAIPIHHLWGQIGSIVAIERVASFGMPVGAEVFETCFWSGRFYAKAEEFHVKDIYRPTRKDIVLHICNSPRANDATVRQALIDRWGAPGKKSAPGPTFGISGDMWAALAVATYVLDTVQP